MAGSARGQPELTSAYRRTGLTSREVWFRHLALGGNADEVSVEAQLYGLLALPSGEYDVLAQAVDEALDDLPRTVTRRPGARVGGLGRVGVVSSMPSWASPPGTPPPRTWPSGSTRPGETRAPPPGRRRSGIARDGGARRGEPTYMC
jgi:hypothetical protein